MELRLVDVEIREYGTKKQLSVILKSAKNGHFDAP
jgi:hypothetical protein